VLMHEVFGSETNLEIQAIFITFTLKTLRKDGLKKLKNEYPFCVQ
jgi:hypothetical protein